METTKIDSYTIEITKPIPVVEKEVVTYNRTFIENQIIAIQKSKDDFDALRDAELAECNQILAEMDKLNIVVKPEIIQEEVVAPIEPLEEVINTDGEQI